MSKQPKGRNDTAWEALFDRYDILSRVQDQGKFFISASQIKEYREPRLMAKFDHRINLPQIFAESKLAILPVTRGDYVISHFEAYQPFEALETSVRRVSLPAFLQSLDPDNIPSEAIAVNCALASGMLSDFLEEDVLCSTVSGRMGSGQFDFDIQNCIDGAGIRISVNNSQIEIDAAFEGYRSLALLEAKRDLAEDFLVRQLYYPYRVWSARVDKKVRPVFLVYSNGIYSFFEYEFQNPDSYNSLVLVKHKNYSIEDTGIKRSDLEDILRRTQAAEEPEIPFPQANSFKRVINLCELLEEQELSREQVTERYDFDVRQTNYYTDAARYLGLVDKRYEAGRKPVYSLSREGMRVMRLSCRQRQLAFCEAIARHGPFRKALRFSLDKGSVPEAGTIVGIMRESGLYKVGSDSTFGRRASTISGWINWMLELAEG